MNKKVVSYLAAGVIALSVAGCSSEQPSPDSPPSQTSAVPDGKPVIDAAVIRGEQHLDYEMFPSVVAAAEHATTLVSGTVAAWHPGREIRDGNDLWKSAVIEITVKSSGGEQSAATKAYIEVSRGVNTVDKNGKEIDPPSGRTYMQTSLEELRHAIPVGTRVIALNTLAPSDAEHEQASTYISVVKRWDPPSTGSSLLAPLPQGLLFEEADGGYASGVADQEDVEIDDWPAAHKNNSSGFEQLLSQLRAAHLLN